MAKKNGNIKTQIRHYESILRSQVAITRLDEELIQMHLESLRNWLRCKKLVEKEGLFIMSRLGAKIPHPAVAMMRSLVSSFIRSRESMIGRKRNAEIFEFRPGDWPLD